MSSREGRRVEMPPRDPSTLTLWAQMLAGPVLWISHFMVVYLAAELSCAARGTPDLEFIGPDALTALVLVSTALWATAIGGTTAWSWRVQRGADGDDLALGWIGVLLGAGSLAAVLAVGTTALFLDPCGP